MAGRAAVTVTSAHPPSHVGEGYGHRSIRALCKNLLTLAEADPARALSAISELVLEVIRRQTSKARVFSSPELDLVCDQIGAKLTADLTPCSEPRDQIVYLLTQVGRYGGHSRVLLDLIAAEPGPEKTLLLTHVAPATRSDIEHVRGAGITVEVAPDGDYAVRARWVASRLAALSPRKTYMMLHPFDAVLVAAARPGLTGQLVYLHNCDHSLALGVHMPHAVHADFHRKGYFHCRRQLGGKVPYIIPLTAPDLGSRHGQAFYRRGHLTSCSSGGFEKFTNDHYLETEPYIYGYPEAVRVLLSASWGTHIHIGPLPPQFLQTIRAQVETLGLPVDRFVHIPNVESVGRTLLEEKVDLYLESVPVGGGRATVEAMGAGLPLLIHANYRSEFLGVEFQVYPSAMIWHDFDELYERVAGLNSAELEGQSIVARAYYEANHSAAALLEALSRIERGVSQPVPEPYRYEPNALQIFLDQHPDISWPI